MIKQWSKYVLVGVLSFILMSATTGGILMMECNGCAHCAAEESTSCCEEPSHNSAGQQQDSANACKIEFWKASDFSVSTNSDGVIKVPVRDLVLSFAAITLFSFEPTISFTERFIPPNNPVYSFGRAILASNCVLII
ncbi:MAG: hypothetical protein LBN93_07070 [Candidatus Symbiothrix sp.]|jgi:hypothetical protein|nr:hypothetical protein [Candidatus Symbiothrix sp.]